MTESPGKSRGAVLLFSLLLLLLGLAIVVGRSEDMPTAEFLRDHVSLRYVSRAVDHKMGQILMVPLGAVVVVFFRLTLGVEMLGPFRPILIALAIEETGLVVGTVFAASVMALVALIRPRLTGSALPYFSRVMILLMVIVLLQVAIVMIGDATDWQTFARLAFFPIVVLCLTADGFARVLARDGPGPAIWRGATTLGIAVAITGIFAIPGCREVFFDYPELLFAEIAAVLLISAYGNLGLFARPAIEVANGPSPL